MSYENPDIPEGINISEKHPIKDFFILVGGLFSIFLVGLFLLFLLSNWLTPFIPFSFERKVTTSFEKQLNASNRTNPNQETIQTYLQNKVNLIAQEQGINDDMPLTVHFIDDDTINAFATLGGHLMIHRGILEILPNENSLVMLLAHEVAHVKHRDPIKSLSRGVILSLMISLITSGSDTNSIKGSLSETGALTSFSFNRDQEREADQEAIATLNAIYGHTNGATMLFEAIQESSKNHNIPEWLSTHPQTEERINDALTVSSNAQSNSKHEAHLTPLPDFIKTLKNSNIDPNHSNE